MTVYHQQSETTGEKRALCAECGQEKWMGHYDSICGACHERNEGMQNAAPRPFSTTLERLCEGQPAHVQGFIKTAYYKGCADGLAAALEIKK